MESNSFGISVVSEFVTDEVRLRFVMSNIFEAGCVS